MGLVRRLDLEAEVDDQEERLAVGACYVPHLGNRRPPTVVVIISVRCNVNDLSHQLLIPICRT